MSAFSPKVDVSAKQLKLATQNDYDRLVSSIQNEDGSTLQDAAIEALQILSEKYNCNYVYAYTTSAQQQQKEKVLSMVITLEMAAKDLMASIPKEPNCLTLTLLLGNLKKILTEAHRDCNGNISFTGDNNIEVDLDQSQTPESQLVTTPVQQGRATWWLVLGRRMVHTLIILGAFKGYHISNQEKDEVGSNDSDSEGDDPEEDRMQYLKAIFSLIQYLAIPDLNLSMPMSGSVTNRVACFHTIKDTLNFVLSPHEWSFLTAALMANYTDSRVVGPLLSILTYCRECLVHMKIQDNLVPLPDLCFADIDVTSSPNPGTGVSSLLLQLDRNAAEQSNQTALLAETLHKLSNLHKRQDLLVKQAQALLA